MLGNYFKPNSKSVLKISLALKGFIGTISAAAFFDGNKDAAFWFLVAGAFIDFLIQCFDSGNNDSTPTGSKAVVVISILALSFLSCNTMKKVSEVTRQDSTWTEYKPVDVKVSGASIVSGFNVDSLVMAIKGRLLAASGQHDIGNIDSILNAALNAFKDDLKGMSPTVITDPESKVQLKYWVDQFGKLNMECTSKDQTIQMLVAEINKLSREKRVETLTKNVPVWYTWGFLGWALFATALLIIQFIIRK